MANINVLKRLEKISDDMAMVRKHAGLYSGVSSKDAKRVLMLLTQISSDADEIAEFARNPIA